MIERYPWLKASRLSLFFLILVSWCFGGAVSWGPYLVAIGGGLCLLAASYQACEAGERARLWSWRILPWILWIGMVVYSLTNPSHQPENPEWTRSFTTPHGKTAKDTLGFSNPAVPVEHVEWAPTTTDVGRTRMYLLVFGGVMAFALALAIMPLDRKELRRWLTVVFANTLVLTAVGVWSFFQDPDALFGRFPTEGNAPFASFHYKNCWTAFAMMSVAMGVGLAHHYWKAGFKFLQPKSPTAFFAFSAPLMMLSLPLRESRAGVVLIGLLMVWLLVTVVLHYREMRFRNDARASLRPVALMLLAVVGMGWYSWRTAAPEFERMFDKSERQVEQIQADDLTGRMILIRDTVAMGKVKPWFGWGLATFSQVYPTFQGPELFHKVNFPGGEDFAWVPTYYEFAHCDWVQFWAELGTVGFALLLLTPLWWYGYCRWNGKANPLSDWLGVGCFLILFLAIFEFPFGSEAVALLFAALLVLGGRYRLMTKAKERRRKRRRKRREEGSSDLDLEKETGRVTIDPPSSRVWS